MEQTTLLEKIRQKTPETPLVRVLSEELSISKHSAYRRIKTEIPLILPEVVKLCRTYNISFDRIMQIDNNDEHETGCYFSMSGEGFQDSYIELLRKTFRILDSCEGEGELYNLTEYIPFYYLFKHPDIHKLNYFIRKRVNDNETPDTPLIEDRYPEEIDEVSGKILEKLKNIHTTWVLSPLWLSSLLNDLNFCKRMGLLSNHELEFYKNAFLFLLSDMENDAGKEAGKVEFRLLLSQVGLNGTTIIFSFGDSLYNLELHQNTNVLISTNTKINRKQKIWAENICRKSVNITRYNIIDRRNFFKSAKTKIEKAFQPAGMQTRE